MSEKRSTIDKLKDESGNAVLGGLAGLLAIGAFGFMFSEMSKADRRGIASSIKPGASELALLHGTADVDLGHGRTEHIVNPIMTKDGLVIGVDKESGQVKIYVDKSHEGTDGDGMGLEGHDIEFTENGKQISDKQAIDDSVEIKLGRADKVDGQIRLNHLKGTNTPVAVATVVARKS